jgi:hypothetical protein
LCRRTRGLARSPSARSPIASRDKPRDKVVCGLASLTRNACCAGAAIPGAGGGSGILGPLTPALRARVAAPLADAFHQAFAWVIAASAIAALGGLVLTVAERRARDAPA